MDDALLVCVLHGVADLHEQREACANGELVLVGVSGDRLAGAEFHDEVGASGLGGAGVEDLGDVGMVHEGQGLSLLLEARDDLACVHAELDDLERNLAADGLLLLGHEDASEAAFADELQELVVADLGADIFGDVGRVRFAAERRWLCDGDGLAADVVDRGGLGKKRDGLGEGVQELEHAGSECLIAACAGQNERAALGWGEIDGGAEDGLDVIVAGGGLVRRRVGGHRRVLRSLVLGPGACRPERVVQPGAGEGPLSVDGAGRQAQCRGGLIDREAGEESQPNDLSRGCVDRLQACEGVIERQNLIRIDAGRKIGQITRIVPTPMGPIAGGARAGPVDEDSSHGLGGGGVEVGPPGPGHLARPGEAEVGLVHEGRGAQGLAGTLGGHVQLCDLSQLLIDEREQAIRSGSVAGGGGMHEERGIIGVLRDRGGGQGLGVAGAGRWRGGPVLGVGVGRWHAWSITAEELGTRETPR